ncbi:MAG: FAD:protein FMN transferase [Pirellulaceae bacterium]
MPTSGAEFEQSGSLTLTDWVERLTGIAVAKTDGSLASEEPENCSVPPRENESEVEAQRRSDSEMPQEAGTSEEDASVVEERFDRNVLISVSRQAMACEFEVLLNPREAAEATEQATEALGLIAELETLLSVYKPRSDLSRLNKFGARNPIEVSSDALQLLELGKAVSEWSEGAFDMTSGTFTELWGFGRRQGRKPSQPQIAEALASVGSKYIKLDLDSSSASLEREGVKVNPGGIGKGYAIDRAARKLVEQGVENFMLHGGLSSICASGNHDSSDSGWSVSLRHPWRWEEHLGTIRLRNRSLGTSGSGKQFFHFGGQRYSHIIDPRTGWPAQHMMSATVLCESAAIADSLATAFFVMGVEATREYCDRNPSVSAVLVHQHAKSGRQEISSFNLALDEWEAS